MEVARSYSLAGGENVLCIHVLMPGCKHTSYCNYFQETFWHPNKLDKYAAMDRELI